MNVRSVRGRLLAWTRWVIAAGLIVALSGCASPKTPSFPLVASPGGAVAERVVLLHGLGRSARAMRRLAARFDEAGFVSTAIGYDSTSQTLDEIVSELDLALQRCCADEAQVNFVTHSLGGLVLRAWVAREGEERVARVVMLSPPNRGTAWVDRLGPFAAWLGPTGSQLGTKADSVPQRLNALGPVRFELGVIAGESRFNWLGSWVLPGPDDGTVAVESTRVDGMQDFLVLPVSHSFMIYDKQVARQAIHFIATGRFEGTPGADPVGGSASSPRPRLSLEDRDRVDG